MIYSKGLRLLPLALGLQLAVQFSTALAFAGDSGGFWGWFSDSQESVPAQSICLGNLEAEIPEHIMSYLNPSDLAAFSQTSRRIRKIGANHKIFKTEVLRLYIELIETLPDYALDQMKLEHHWSREKHHYLLSPEAREQLTQGLQESGRDPKRRWTWADLWSLFLKLGLTSDDPEFQKRFPIPHSLQRTAKDLTCVTVGACVATAGAVTIVPTFLFAAGTTLALTPACIVFPPAIIPAALAMTPCWGSCLSLMGGTRLILEPVFGKFQDYEKQSKKYHQFKAASLQGFQTRFGNLRELEPFYLMHNPDL